MKKLLLILAFSLTASASENTFVNMKNCESIVLSKLTTLISCHQMDYLVEYRNIDDEEKDRIKKVTVVTPKSQVIIKNVGK